MLHLSQFISVDQILVSNANIDTLPLTNITNILSKVPSLLPTASVSATTKKSKSKKTTVMSQQKFVLHLGHFVEF